MKKEELKKVLKPLIKECIKEVIFEDGTLSGIVAEVAQGLGRTPLVEAAPAQQEVANPRVQQEALLEQQQHQIAQRKKKLLSAINSDAYGGIDLFEGTTPLSSGGSVSKGPQPQGPLSDMDPADPGVDISGILGMAGNRWSAYTK
jgi:hypothetical protein